LQIDGLKEAKMRQRREDAGLGGVLTEELDGADAIGVENVVDVGGKVVADSGGGNGDAGGPLLDDLFDVEKTVVARGL
jgi:hypothetical protein